jgi:peptidyl-prolyl cis-trans isomerase A (cyclophilin A)
MQRLFLGAMLLLLLGCGGKRNSAHPQVAIRTSMGDIEIAVYTDKAPVSANAFLRYVDSGYYNNGAFYRVLLQEGAVAVNNAGLIQGGIWPADGQQPRQLPGIAHETTQQTGLSHTSGTVSLARTAPGTANTEFFICIGSQTQFDYGHNNNGDSAGFAAFGKVIKGMQVAREIQQQPANGERLEPRVVIQKVERL